VEHLIVLFNLLTLVAGLAVVGALFRRWKADPRPLVFWQFLHFVAFTFTMAVAALDAYGVVNLGVGAGLTRWWSSAVMVGTAGMLFSFPHLSRAEACRPRPPRFSWFWGAWTVVPLACAVLVAFIADYGVLLIVIAVAFLPFWAAIVYGLAIGTRPEDKAAWKGWVVFGLLLSLGFGEVWWIVTHPPQAGYFFVTLPLAYLYTVWTTWRSTPRSVGPGALAVPESLGRDLGVTPRELEVAGGILRGLSNKELAFELGLSEHTVRNHISNLYRKLGIQKRLDLVLLVQKYQGV
jgi:DNA-binding CsgD family transcriptional regulator